MKHRFSDSVRSHFGWHLGSMGLVNVRLPAQLASRALLFQYRDGAASGPEFNLFFQRDVKSHNVVVHGSRFTIELRLPDTVDVLGTIRSAKRLSELLTLVELESLRTVQNKILPGCRLKSHVQPYVECQDVWFHYREDIHIATWSNALLPILPVVKHRFTESTRNPA